MGKIKFLESKDKLPFFAVIFLLISYFFITPNTKNKYEPFANTKIALNDSLPYYIYQPKLDSINKIRNKEIKNNDSKINIGTSIGTFGIVQFDSIGNDESNFIELKYFRIKDGFKFIVQNDKYYIIDFNGKKIDSINYKFSVSNNTLYFPIKKTIFKIIKIIQWIAFAIITILFILIIVVLPITIISSISYSKPFKESNYKNLKIATKIQFGFLLLSIGLLLCMYFVKYNQFSNYFVFDFRKTFCYYRVFFIIAFVYYILSNAFKRGTQLQKENDLTI